MQYSMVNYLFPLLIFTITCSVAINFFVVLIKLLFTSDITPAMRMCAWTNFWPTDSFPKWKFFVMGSLDGLSLLFLLVGGAYVSGIKQLILLQGITWLNSDFFCFSGKLWTNAFKAAVPITMVFSLLLLRYKGNHVCQIAREILDQNSTQYTELYLGEDVIAKAEGAPLCRLLINGMWILASPKQRRFFLKA